MAEERALDSHSKLCHKVFRKSFDTWSYIKPKSEGFKKQFIDIFEENSPLILFSTRGKKEEKNFKNERKKKVNWKTNERRRKVDERERGGGVEIGGMEAELSELKKNISFALIENHRGGMKTLKNYFL